MVSLRCNIQLRYDVSRVTRTPNFLVSELHATSYVSTSAIRKCSVIMTNLRYSTVRINIKQCFMCMKACLVYQVFWNKNFCENCTQNADFVQIVNFCHVNSANMVTGMPMIFVTVKHHLNTSWNAVYKRKHLLAYHFSMI